MKRQRSMGLGRIFRRKSRVTRKALPTYWIAYYIRDQQGRAKEVRESAETTDYAEAKELLKKRLGEATAESRGRFT